MSPSPVVDHALVLAWRVVPRLPPVLARALFAAVADVVWWRRGGGVRRLEANLARVRPHAGPAALRRLSRAGMRSYLRYWCDAFSLPAWSRERLLSAVTVHGEDRLREVHSQGRGAAFFLGHCGNWDHLGAWGACELGPVTTVAERLRPERVFDAFLAYRASLGIRALPHAGAGFTELVRSLRGGGLVPLVADRDLTGTGVEVVLFGEPARVAAGPAALALASGAPLFAVTCHYQRPSRWWRAHTLVGAVHEVPVPGRTAGGRAAQVQAMTQACVDHVARGIDAHPQDWHMLQRVFTADTLVPRPAPA